MFFEVPLPQNINISCRFFCTGYETLLYVTQRNFQKFGQLKLFAITNEPTLN